MSQLEPGQSAPDFTLSTDGGGSITLSTLRGAPVVVYFYPKDDTSGCTAQAIAFSRDGDAYAALGATVIGISKDSPKSHDRFKAKHALTIRLASDEDTAVAQAWGVWMEKSLYGRKYMGMDRATFLIGADGAIRRIWRKVKVPGHSASVLEALSVCQAKVDTGFAA